MASKHRSSGSRAAARGDGGRGTKRRRNGKRRGRLRRGIHRMGDSWQELLDRNWLWLPLFLLVGTWALTPGGFLFSSTESVGSIASRDYVASRDLLVEDPDRTQTKAMAARDAVLPIWNLDSTAAERLDDRLAQLWSGGQQILDDLEDDGPVPPNLPEILTEALRVSTGLAIEPRQMQVFVRRGFPPELGERIRGLAEEALRLRVVEDKQELLDNRMRGILVHDLESGGEEVDLELFDRLERSEELPELLAGEVRDWPDLSPEEEERIVAFLAANIPVNLRSDPETTEMRRDAAEIAAREQPEQRSIRKGQVIVRKGDEIDAVAAEAIREMTGRRRWEDRAPQVAGTFGLVALAALVLWIGGRHERVYDHSRSRIFNEGLVLLLTSLLGAKFFLLTSQALATSFDRSPFNSAESYAYAVPFAALALVTSLLLGRGLALLLALLFSVLVSRLLVGAEPLGMVIYSLAGSFAALYGVERYPLKQRLAMTRIGLLVGVVNVVMIALLRSLSGEIGEGGAGELGFSLVCGLAGGLLAAAVAGFLLPILESAFAIATDIKLIELANTNLPLLRRLAFEAPGTFQHSLMVANLSKEGCEAIDADPVTAYTGALYHDIGKVLRPDYYIENQRPEVNPHDDLRPSMSALVLISHVKDGLELAAEHHLPKPVHDAIAQHHGTRVITFFLNRARERAADESREVREEDYRYPGPKPQSREMGVLMLADGVEAASRTLVAPTREKIEGLIQRLVDDCVQDGQLDDTELTLGDLRRVADAFLRVLTTIFHQRIDYPGFDFNQTDTRPGAPEPATAEPEPEPEPATDELPAAAMETVPGSGEGLTDSEEALVEDAPAEDAAEQPSVAALARSQAS